MSPLDLASAAVEQQRRLREDALKRVDAAQSARADAEVAHASAVDAHAIAMQASAAKRNDDKLATAAGVASVRRDHAANDLARAAGAHEQAQADVEAAAKRLTAAEQAHELAQTLEALGDPAVDNELRDHGAAIAAALADVRDRVLLVRGHLSRSAVLAARARELGQADARPHDGLACSVGIAAKLAELGGAIGQGDAGHSLRWPLMSPPPDADVYATGAVRQLAGAVTELIEQGARHRQAGVAYGQAALSRVAEAWTGHRNFGMAREDSAQRDRERVAAREAADAKAHNERLRRGSSATRFAGPTADMKAHAAAAKAAQAQIDAEIEARIGPEAMAARHGTLGRIPPNPLLTTDEDLKV